MAQSRRRRFPKDLARLADLAKALSHPARIQILQILAAKKSCICGELVDDLPLSQSTVSQHLKELKRAGLIVGEIEGLRTCYCASRERLTQLHELVGVLLEESVEVNTAGCD